jgi:hypothetical protein
MSRSRYDALLAAVLVAVAGLAACGDGEPVAAPSTTRTVTVTAEPGGDATSGGTPSPTGIDTATGTTTGTTEPEDEPPAPGSTGTVQAEPSGGQVFLVAARVGTHPGYDRVVWELDGDGTPGYRVGWTDDPRYDGSGDPVDLPGDETLQVVLMGVGWPPDAPAGITPYDGPQTLTLPGAQVITQVEVGTIFEGYLTGFVGADDDNPFQVTLLSNPTRVVVDIAH